MDYNNLEKMDCEICIRQCLAIFRLMYFIIMFKFIKEINDKLGKVRKRFFEMIMIE